MGMITLTTLAATLISFAAVRSALRWLVPLIPNESVRQHLAGPSASGLLPSMVAVAAGLAAMNAASPKDPISMAIVARQNAGSQTAKDAASVSEADAIARLAAFVRKTERHAPSPMTPFPANHPTEGLADVETLMARLAARLEADGSDAEGWRTLGWSYFATENFAAAAKAYDRAVALRPDDDELKRAAAEAKTRAVGRDAPPVAVQPVAGVAQE